MKKLHSGIQSTRFNNTQIDKFANSFYGSYVGSHNKTYSTGFNGVLRAKSLLTNTNHRQTVTRDDNNQNGRDPSYLGVDAHEKGPIKFTRQKSREIDHPYNGFTHVPCKEERFEPINLQMSGTVFSKYHKYQSPGFDERTNYGIDHFYNIGDPNCPDKPRAPNNMNENVHHIVYDGAGQGKEYVMGFPKPCLDKFEKQMDRSQRREILGMSKTPNPYDMEKVHNGCLLYTSPSPRDRQKSRMPSSA